MQQRTELEVLLRQSLDDVKAEILRPLGSGSGMQWTVDVNGRCTDVGLIEKERAAGREKEVQVVLLSVASNLCRSLRMRAMAEGQDTAFLL